MEDMKKMVNNYDETHINKISEMSLKMSDMIIREITPDYTENP